MCCVIHCDARYLRMRTQPRFKERIFEKLKLFFDQKE